MKWVLLISKYYKVLRYAIKSAYFITKFAIQQRVFFVSDAVDAQRFAVCKTCDRFDPMITQCRECMCFVKIKTKLRAEKCPLGKWE